MHSVAMNHKKNDPRREQRFITKDLLKRNDDK